MKSNHIVWRLERDEILEATEEKVSEEQGGFRKGRGCVDQIFAMKVRFIIRKKEVREGRKEGRKERKKERWKEASSETGKEGRKEGKWQKRE